MFLWETGLIFFWDKCPKVNFWATNQLHLQFFMKLQCAVFQTQYDFTFFPAMCVYGYLCDFAINVFKLGRLIPPTSFFFFQNCFRCSSSFVLSCNF